MIGKGGGNFIFYDEKKIITLSNNIWTLASSSVAWADYILRAPTYISLVFVN